VSWSWTCSDAGQLLSFRRLKINLREVEVRQIPHRQAAITCSDTISSSVISSIQRAAFRARLYAVANVIIPHIPFEAIFVAVNFVKPAPVGIYNNLAIDSFAPCPAASLPGELGVDLRLYLSGMLGSSMGCKTNS
jgi:hypothetical protein